MRFLQAHLNKCARAFCWIPYISERHVVWSTRQAEVMLAAHCSGGLRQERTQGIAIDARAIGPYQELNEGVIGATKRRQIVSTLRLQHIRRPIPLLSTSSQVSTIFGRRAQETRHCYSEPVTAIQIGFRVQSHEDTNTLVQVIVGERDRVADGELFAFCALRR